MKKIIEIKSDKNPDVHDLHLLVAQAIDQSITKEISISPLSQDGVMKRIEQGKLTFKEMEDDMKISQSKFFHYYTGDTKEVIIQIHADKLAVFSDWSLNLIVYSSCVDFPAAFLI